MKLLFGNRKKSNEAVALDALSALNKSLAIIEFTVEGAVIRANDNFLSLMGYTSEEIVNKHHRIFVLPSDFVAGGYDAFWADLRRGVSKAERFRRITKTGDEVWLEASYNPMVDHSGQVYRVIKVAKDITADFQHATDAQGQLAAIGRSQAVIEFSLDGTVLTANENFCRALGYDLSEIQGRNHRLFVTTDEAGSAAYADFWTTLNSGKFFSAEFKRIGKSGQVVWIQASYNPIFDLNGRPYKVVKYATDITARKNALASIGDSLITLAQGDLTSEIRFTFPDDLEPVRIALNDTVRQFGKTVAELRQTSMALRNATSEILAGANDLADRTTRQAAAVEETSATLEHLAQAVVENAGLAENACVSARQVSASAVGLGEVMSDANAAMGEVSAQAVKISNIIGMIDDIAFQTNLLALNASVEAARAGDAGKGFAVVAIEVRRLAQSAARASHDVKELIEESNTAVGSGTKLVAMAAARLKTIVESVKHSSGLVEAIAEANKEQSVSLAEVNGAVRQIDEMTQHNAALVEETNAAIEQTEGQASRLDSLVERFKISQPSTAQALATSTMRPSTQVSSKRFYPNQGNIAVGQDWESF